MPLYGLTLFGVLHHAAFNGSRVAVSLYAISLHASPATIGTMMALYGLLPMLLAVSTGRIIDRVGTRMPMLAGSAVVAVGLIIPFVWRELAALYVASGLIGLAFMVQQVAAQNVVGYIGRPEDRPKNFSVISLGFSMGSLIGPLIAGFGIDWVGHANTFLLLALLPLAPVAVLALDRLPLPRVRPMGERSASSRIIDLLKHRELRRIFITSGLVAAGWDLFSFMMPIYGSRVGLSASLIGLVMGAFAAATLLIRMCLPYLTRRLTAWRLLQWAMMLSGATFVLLPLVHNVLLLMALAFALGLALGGTQPMVMALLHDAVPAGRTGAAVGLRTAMINGSQTAMPLIFGGLGSIFGVTPVFWVAAACMIAGGRLFRSRKP
ncbi:MAG: MFS transporter [Betaproteobacteria bacterium]|nr:MFS transporter [Betaproteobacteria bacterium]